MTAAPRVVEVVAGVIVENGRVLMTQRLDGDRFPGLWEFPGGKVDPGETHAEALIRELQEEIAIESRVGALYETLSYTTEAGIRLDIYFYRTEHVAGDPACLEVQDWEWSGPSRLQLLEIIPSNRPVVERLIRELEAGA